MVKRLKKGRTHTKKTTVKMLVQFLPSWIMSFPGLQRGAQSLKQSSINQQSSINLIHQL